MNDYLNVKDWADKTFKEHLETVKYYISQGIDKVQAVKMVLKDSTLGEGYKSQLRHEFGLSMFA